MRVPDNVICILYLPSLWKKGLDTDTSHQIRLCDLGKIFKGKKKTLTLCICIYSVHANVFYLETKGLPFISFFERYTHHINYMFAENSFFLLLLLLQCTLMFLKHHLQTWINLENWRAYFYCELYDVQFMHLWSVR